MMAPLGMIYRLQADAVKPELLELPKGSWVLLWGIPPQLWVLRTPGASLSSGFAGDAQECMVQISLLESLASLEFRASLGVRV